MVNKMDHNIGKEDVSLEFLEKTLRDFYRKEESCRGWETNVVTQPKAVNNIVNVGASRIAAGMGVGDELKDKNVAGMIDHTLLKQDATPAQIKVLCKEAKEYSFASVCINPSYVSLCSDLLKGTPVKVCTVIGFPLGTTTTEVKQFETFEIILEIEAKRDIGDYLVNLAFFDQEEKNVAETFSIDSGFFIPTGENETQIRARFESFCLNPGKYFLQIGVIEKNANGGRGEVYFAQRGLLEIVAKGESIGYNIQCADGHTLRNSDQARCYCRTRQNG